MVDRPRRIADAISSAIIAQTLPPGTKLGERELSEVCDTSRAVIKQALIMVAESGLVETRRNRGASVAQLTIRDAFELFESLTALEQGVAFQLMHRLSGLEWEVLQQHVDLTQACMDCGNNEEADRIGPGFHSQLVALTRNRALASTHDQLVRKSQLLRQLYVNRDYHRCRLNDDHQELVTLMKSKQVDPVLKLVEGHYQSIARGFDMDGPVSLPADLGSALEPWLAREPELA